MNDYDSIFNLNEMFCFALYSTSNAMMRFYAKPLGDLGITYPQLLVLIALWENDNIPISMISEKTCYDLGSLTPIIKRLETEGMVETSIDPLDRRRRKVRLTKQGLEIKKPVAQIFENMRCKINLSEDELAVTLNVFRKIKKSLSV